MASHQRPHRCVPWRDAVDLPIHAQELSRLDDSASIYKLTGPILVKQDLDMSKSTVKERLTFIKAQLCVALC